MYNETQMLQTTPDDRIGIESCCWKYLEILLCYD